jgi:Haloacid dehalogenase-like hydrolase
MDCSGRQPDLGRPGRQRRSNGMPCRYRKTLLLDLDGTLIDPASGIIGSCRYALERLHLEVPEEENLRWIIGPPLRESFERLLRGQADAEAALKFYRERYAERGFPHGRRSQVRCPSRFTPQGAHGWSALGLRRPGRARECWRGRHHRSPSRPSAVDGSSHDVVSLNIRRPPPQCRSSEACSHRSRLFRLGAIEAARPDHFARD